MNLSKVDKALDKYQNHFFKMIDHNLIDENKKQSYLNELSLIMFRLEIKKKRIESLYTEVDQNEINDCIKKSIEEKKQRFDVTLERMGEFFDIVRCTYCDN